MSNKTHGGYGTPTYESWRRMLYRCRNPKAHNYKRYGGRGITVCQRWQSFENFLADMGERPAGTSIDRINGSKGYEPSNCRWATAHQQANNVSTVHLLTYDGTTKSISEWARLVDIKRSTILERIRIRGWTVEQALTTPPHRRINK